MLSSKYGEYGHQNLRFKHTRFGALDTPYSSTSMVGAERMLEKENAHQGDGVTHLWPASYVSLKVGCICRCHRRVMCFVVQHVACVSELWEEVNGGELTTQATD